MLTAAVSGGRCLKLSWENVMTELRGENEAGRKDIFSRRYSGRKGENAQLNRGRGMNERFGSLVHEKKRRREQRLGSKNILRRCLCPGGGGGRNKGKDFDLPIPN